MENTKKILKFLILIGFVFLVLIIFSQKIDLTNIDLGRHLENGKIVWQNPQVLWQNFYSYTEPGTAFINHHWLSGVIFYSIYSLGGFKLLSIFNALLAALIFLLAFNFSRKKAGFYLSSLVALPVIFLLSERTEIRPEIFSYLLIALTWILIDQTGRDKKWHRLFWFIPLLILWVNLHIYFVLGLGLIGFKLAAEFFTIFIKSAGSFKLRFKETWPVIKPWVLTLAASFLACLINPNTWRGLLYPFNIFQNYGYEIAENKSIFYLGHLMINSNFLLFKIILVGLVASWVIYSLFSKKIKLFELFISLFFSVLALTASRNLAIFGVIALMIIPANLFNALKYFKQTLTISDKIKIYCLSFFIVLIVASGIYLIISSKQIGLGLVEGNDGSAKFFKANNLSGPIFNNYDLGSALIFWLYPQEKVFVDNRPEAYSVRFFKNVYVPMQNEAKKWEEINRQYKFKTIYFSYNDSTPWAQQFLGRILKDSDWALVYFDKSTVILLNKKLTAGDLLEKLSLNEKSFRDKLRVLAGNSNLKDRLSLGALAEKAGQPLLAEEIYQETLIKSPEYNPAIIALGSLYASSGQITDLNKATSYFEKALNNGYKLPEIYNQIGLANWNLGEYKKAESSWHSALKLDHKNTSALYYLNQIEELRRAGRLPFN